MIKIIILDKGEFNIMKYRKLVEHKKINGILAIMKIKRVIIPTITMVVIASQLFGCSSATKQETYNMLQDSTEIELEYAELDTVDNKEISSLDWIELGNLTTYSDLRASWDKIVGVTGTTGNKEGILYTNPLTTQADQNITLLLAIKNSQFRGYLVSPDELAKLGEIAAENYTDIDVDDVNAPYATINAYFELLPDQEDGQFDGDATISRAQAMTLVMRATTQVNEAQAPDEDADFTKAVGETQYTNFAAPMDEYAYLNTSTGLNDKNFSSAMSKGEYIYLLANYYSQDFQEYMDNNGFKNNTYLEDVTISTVSDAGDISFSEAISDSSKGVPSDMYKAFQTAINMNLITESDLEDWDSAITKGEAIRLFTSMSLTYYQVAGQDSLTDEITDNIVYPDVNPEDVDPKTTNMDADTAFALGKKENAEIDEKYGSSEAWAAYALSQGADGIGGWCWVYYTGQGAGSEESYAVYMKEDSPRKGEIFHLGDYLPDGTLFTGANIHEHGIADDREFERMYENGDFGDGLTIDEDGTIIIN